MISRLEIRKTQFFGGRVDAPPLPDGMESFLDLRFLLPIRKDFLYSPRADMVK